MDEQATFLGRFNLGPKLGPKLGLAPRPILGLTALLSLTYFLTASIGILLTRESGNVAALWPPNAILLAALLRSDKRAWPPFFAGCAAANIFANLSFGNSISVAGGFAACNMAEVLAAALLVGRFLESPYDLTTSRQTLGFAVIAGIAAPVVGAFCGAGLISFAYSASYWSVWQTWWIADAMGLLIITPVLLTWTKHNLAQLRSQGRTREAMVLLLTVSALSLLLFSQDRFPLLYLIVPVLLWAAFRLGLFACTLAGLVVSAVALSLTVYGTGPIPPITPAGMGETIQFLQLFLGVTVLIPMMVAVLLGERQRVQTSLFVEQERARVTLQSIGDAVITTDARGIVEYLNPVAESLTGWTADEARGEPLRKVFHIIEENSRDELPDPVNRCLEEGTILGLANHTLLISREGQEYAIEASAAPIKGRDDELLGAVLVFHDVTESRRISKEMGHQATHDAFTGLVNRREFEHRLTRVLQSIGADDSEHALCYLDLDQFKVINDTCGHVAGDELLRQLAQVFSQQVRKRDTLSHLGGDEFGILMELCPLDQARRVAESLRGTVADFRFEWEGKSFSVGVSIGLVPITAKQESVTSVLSAADTACSAAKDKGPHRIHIYGETDAEMARRQGETGWASRIERALEENRFRFDFQPIVPIHQGTQNDTLEEQGDHYELLLRLEDEEGEVVSPGTFMPAAERFGLAVNIDMWVINAALSWLASQPSHLQRLRLCSINLSGQSLADETFLAYVTAQFELHGVPPQKICFEITETAAISNLASATHLINALETLGCRFALDDFGSGVCSFAYLKNLSVDYLKIDGVFIKDIVDDPVDLAMVRSIHEVGKLMGKKTIAKCVETTEILEKLRDIGVDYAQGSAIGLPQPMSKLSELGLA